MDIPVKTGLAILRENRFNEFSKLRIGVLCHSASVDEKLCHIIDILADAGLKVEMIFAPEHGFFANAQDQVSIENTFHPKYKIPIISLYGKNTHSLSVDAQKLRNIDVILIDLQDVGARYYTFVWTAALLIKSAAKTEIAVRVLDRPNPINGISIEGPVQDEDFLSFVGLYRLPIRHGMTIGEMLSYVVSSENLELDFEIIKMQVWQRTMWFDETGLPWVLPSPNMPTLDTAIVYPGMCLLEGTNLSEGRGTTKPFEIFGAPFIDQYKLCENLNNLCLPGVIFRPLSFLPTFGKYSGKACGGAQIHIIDRDLFKPVITAFAIISEVISLYPSEFRFSSPPYEFEKERIPFDILSGSPKWRQMLLRQAPLDEFEKEFAESNEKLLAELYDFRIY